MRVESRLEPVNQSVVITISVPGLARALTYRTDATTARVAAYRWPINTLAPDQEISVEIAGRSIPLTADASGMATFVWDGADKDGFIVGRAVATVKVDDGPLVATLGRWDSRVLGLGGLMIDPCDYLDSNAHQVHSGRGWLHGSMHVTTEDNFFLVAKTGGRFTSRFDASGRHVAVLDSVMDDEVWSFEYDEEGLARLQSHAGPEVVCTRRAGGLSIARDGWQIDIATDELGRVESVVDPSKRGVRFAYSSDGLLSTLVDASGFERHYEYDEVGRLISAADPGKQAVQLVRTNTERGHRVTLVSAEGRESYYQVERLADGTKVRTSHCCGGETTVTRIRGNLTEVTRADGSVIKSLRSAAGAEVHVVLPSGVEHIRTTNNGNVTVNGNSYEQTTTPDEIASTSPEGRQMTMRRTASTLTVDSGTAASLAYRFDESGKVCGVSQGSTSTQVRYDDQNLVKELQNSDGSLARFEYDESGWLTAQQFSDEHLVRLERDGGGLVRAVHPPGRPPTTFDYAARGEIRAITFPSATGPDRIEYKRDGDGLVVERQVTGGEPIRLRRGAHGLTDEIVTGKQQTRFEYDGNRPTSATTSDGTATSLTYDGSVLTSIERSGKVQGKIEYLYNAGLQFCALRSGDLTIDYRQDCDGLIIGVGPAEISRDTAGRVTTISAGPIEQRDSYDDDDRLAARQVTISGRLVWEISYSYDKGGRVASIHDNHLESPQEFRYDSRGRLNEVGGPGAFAAEYDGSGAMLTVSRDDVEVTCRVDSSGRIVQIGNKGLSYGPGGVLERIDDGSSSRSHHWDAIGRLIGVQLGNGSGSSLSRDGFGILTSIESSAGMRTNLLSGVDGQPLATTSDEGVPQTLFGRLSPWASPLIATQPERTLYLVSDHVGSTRLIIDVSNGEVIEQRGFDAWGKQIQREGNAGLPFGFAGGIDDQSSGLVHFPARSYDPGLMQWLSRDPKLFLGGSLNLYSYCDDDPVNHRDPTGRGVEICRMPADSIPIEGAEHWWIKTTEYEAGMLPEPLGEVEILPTAVVDHSGWSEQSGAKCDPIIEIDEACVNRALQTNKIGRQGIRYGEYLGRWRLGNTCQDFADEVLDACSGGDYEVITSEPEAYDHWYSPNVTTTSPDYSGEDSLMSGGDAANASWLWD